ncbi:MAG: clostripain-related cysteine peptidase [Firmicutes bacterium]|nr:clostripain-related cysteine peptidase [Bacillota bacterium]
MDLSKINFSNVPVNKNVSPKVFREIEKKASDADKVEISGKAALTSEDNLLKNAAQVGAAPASKDAAPAKKKWTILQYSAADNNLTSAMVDDINDMESVGSSPETNLVAQLDTGGKEGGRRYFLVKDSDKGKINSPVLQKLGDVNMSDPKVLADFIKWGMKNYPAEHYMLILSDHGGGWEGAIQDEGSGGWMSIDDIKQGIKMAQDETGKKVDVLGFDACLMASTEVGYELKNQAKYMVASEETEGADGWPYTRILTSKTLKNIQNVLRKKIDLPPEELAKKIVRDSESDQGTISTLSALDMSKMDTVAKAADNLAGQIIKTDTSKGILKDIARGTESFNGFKDLYHFAEQITSSDKIKDEELKKSAQEVVDVLKNTVLAEQHSDKYPNAHGLTVELPSWGSPSPEYKKTDFAKDTKWEDALKKLS